MTTITLRWLLIGLLLLATGIAHAEDGCPPGLIPASGTNINSCVPIPSGYYNNPQQAHPQPLTPPPRWVERWGAIASDGPAGILGAATNLSSQNQAEQRAMMDCQSRGGKKCKLDGSYGNQCAAVVVGSSGYNIQLGITVDEAVEKGMKTCSSTGGIGCHAYYSDCSLPQRIQ